MNYYEETAYYYCMNAHYGVCPFSSTNKCNGYAYLDSTCQLEKALDNTILSKEMIIKIHLGKAKLNGLVASHYCQIYGFPAFKELENHCDKSGEKVIIATDSPATMLDRGVQVYFAPVLQRNTIYHSAREILVADLDVNVVMTVFAPEITSDDDVIIASRHHGTVELLKNMFPKHTVLGTVTPEQIRNTDVVGTLPPHLIGCCRRYKPATIKDFNYVTDGDISGNELKDRLMMGKTITCVVV